MTDSNNITNFKGRDLFKELNIVVRSINNCQGILNLEENVPQMRYEEKIRSLQTEWVVNDLKRYIQAGRSAMRTPLKAIVCVDISFYYKDKSAYRIHFNDLSGEIQTFREYICTETKTCIIRFEDYEDDFVPPYVKEYQSKGTGRNGEDVMILLRMSPDFCYKEMKFDFPVDHLKTATIEEIDIDDDKIELI